MTNLNKPFPKLNIKGLFLVWGYPQGSHRSQLMAQALGMPIEYVYLMQRQGLLSAALKYPYQALKTPLVLLRHRPEVVFVQNPPIFGALIVYLWGLITGTRLIIDSHTDALLAEWWAWTWPLHRYLSKRAITTLVTNEHLKEVVNQWNAPAYVLVDPPETHPDIAHVALDKNKFHVVMVSSAAYDEPVNEVLEVAQQLPDIQFHITGNFARAPHHQDIQERTPDNVRLTGYLPDAEFYGLLKSAHIVMAMTTENHTIQSGAAEGLWLGRPIITSNWPILQAYFTEGAVLVDNSVDSIRQAILTIQANYAQYEENILRLQHTRRSEWWQRASGLIGLILQKSN